MTRSDERGFGTRRRPHQQRLSSPRRAASAVPIVLILVLPILVPVSGTHAGDLTREVVVSWDFGSGPGKTSDFYVGERKMPVNYSTAECLSRFILEEVRYEFSQVEVDGKLAPEGPPFLMLTLRKQFAGDFKLLPEVRIAQSRVNKKGKATGKTTAIVFPFRQKEMAAPVDDWSATGIGVSLGAPGAIMDLQNPMDWVEIQITCE